MNSEPMPKRLMRRSRNLLLWLGSLPAALSIVAYLTSSRHIQSVRATQQTDAFVAELNGLLASVRDAETGQRGYLLSGDESYLAPFLQARSTIDSQLAHVVQTARERGIADSDLDAVLRLVHSKMSELQTTVSLQQKGHHETALAVVKSNRGEGYMIELRAIVARIRAQQDRLLVEAERQQNQRQRLLEAVLLTGVLLGVGLAVVAYRLNIDYERERDQIDAHIQQTVREKTAELQQRTRELELRSAELQRSNADLTQFAYVSSHDLQEPLRTVASYVQLLARRYGDKLDETAQTYIAFAVDGAVRMQALINDLLEYSRLGTQKLQLSPSGLQEIVQAALSNLSATTQETGARVECGPLPVLCVDARKLELVFQNLISNAIKFHKPGIPPAIDIRAHHDNGSWKISVQDNGIGFDERYTSRIFDIFQRLHGVGEYAGNGIGLAVCRRIIEHHGGRLWATSQPGNGSTFYFTLPE